MIACRTGASREAATASIFALRFMPHPFVFAG